MVWTPVLCLFWFSALGLASCSEQSIRNQDIRHGHANAHRSVEPSRNLPGKSKRSGDGWYTWPKGYQPQQPAYTAPWNGFQKSSNRILNSQWDQISQQSQGQRPTTQLQKIPESRWVQTSQPIQPLSTAESKALDELWRKQWHDVLQKLNEEGKMSREDVRNSLEGFMKEQWPLISQKIPDGSDILADFQKQSEEFLNNQWPSILQKAQDQQSNQEQLAQQNRGQLENNQPSQKTQGDKLPNTEIQSVSEDFLKNHWPKILQELQEQTEAIHKEQNKNNNFFGNRGQAQNLQKYNGASNAENQKVNNQNINNSRQPALQGTNEQGQRTRVQQQNYQSLQNVNWQLRTQENRGRGENQSDERQQTLNNAAGQAAQQQNSNNFNRQEQIRKQNAKEATAQILRQQWQQIAEDSANNRPKEERQETPSESQRAPNPRPILTKHHKIELWTQEIPEPVEVKVEKEVPYPVHVVEERPVPYPVEKPYPVVIEKKVNVPVAVHVPYPVPVYKEVHVPVALTEERLVPFKVQKTVPVLFEKKEFYTLEKKQQPEAESVEVIKSYQVPVSEEWKQASLSRPNKAEDKADSQGSVEYRGQIVAPYRGRLSQKVPLLFREQGSGQGLESRRPNKGNNGIDYYKVFEEPDALPNGREQNQARKTNGYTWQDVGSYIDFLQSAKRVKRNQLEE